MFYFDCSLFLQRVESAVFRCALYPAERSQSLSQTLVLRPPSVRSVLLLQPVGVHPHRAAAEGVRVARHGMRHSVCNCDFSDSEFGVVHNRVLPLVVLVVSSASCCLASRECMASLRSVDAAAFTVRLCRCLTRSLLLFLPRQANFGVQDASGPSCIAPFTACNARPASRDCVHTTRSFCFACSARSVPCYNMILDACSCVPSTTALAMD
jgi:hypothetical protein